MSSLILKPLLLIPVYYCLRLLANCNLSLFSMLYTTFHLLTPFKFEFIFSVVREHFYFISNCLATHKVSSRFSVTESQLRNVYYYYYYFWSSLVAVTPTGNIAYVWAGFVITNSQPLFFKSFWYFRKFYRNRNLKCFSVTQSFKFAIFFFTLSFL